MKPDQVSLAIGKGGHNIKLASRLVGYEIDVFRDVEDVDEDEDIELSEFADEIEGWILEELRRIGLDTAKSVIELGKDTLVKRSDLEEETVEHILTLLRREFE
jgi:N utilization substance protein A